MSAPAQTLQRRPTLADWVTAARPKTLVAAVIPVCVGTSLAAAAGLARAMPALAAAAGAILIQIGTNLTNDYYDFIRGADTADRVGPKRVTQSGLIAPPAVLRAAVITFAMATFVGLDLAREGGWPIVVVGVLSILSGYAYTGGPYPLGYHGLGDLFVFVFFGPVAVAGTWYVQAHTLGPVPILAGLPVGALATALLVVNNLRDVETDTRAGKRTLVVRAGVTAGRAEYVALAAVALATPVLLWAMGSARAPVLIALLSVPIAVAPMRTVLTRSGAALNPALGATARFLGVFGLLLCVGLLAGSA